jgi:Ca2+-binding RTX toxin-like protein
LIGGNGNDLYVVDNVSNSITENDAEGTDSVQSSVTFTLSSHVENLTLTGKTAINGTGNDQDNIIAGNTAANTLNGGIGNDTLDGGADNDSLTGGDGADILKFNTALGKPNIDTVTDFAHGTDQLQLDDATFKKFIGSSGQVGADNFVSGGNGVKALDTNDYLIFNTTTGALFYDADGSGKGAAFQFATITLVGVQELSASDFLVI